MKFIDTTEIDVKAGDGGDGIVCFARGHSRPKLGPDGGNGGIGGSIYLRANRNLNTLSGLYYRKSYNAENGGRGGPNNRTGRCGDDLYIDVPCGTVVTKQSIDSGPDDESDVVGEVLVDGDTLLVAKGGSRGYGNLHFVSATHQAPEEATKGKPGEHWRLNLELKLLADIGLAGFPNAGKSTLLSRLSAAKPKIASYPFTTLTPQLGVMADDEDPSRALVIADIPGLIEGAAEGRGLGHQFLRHLERTSLILFLLPALDLDHDLSPDQAAAILAEELLRYSPELAQRPRVYVVTKMDLCGDHEMDLELDASVKKLEQVVDAPVLRISSISGAGITELKRFLLDRVRPVTRRS